MSDSNLPPQSGPPTVNTPDNPYNIDFEKERQLKKWFFILIGGGFIVAAVLLIVAFILDSLNKKEIPPPAPRPAPVSSQTTQNRAVGVLDSPHRVAMAHYLPHSMR